MASRWAVRFAVTGDLRFCSHKDMMRAIERTAVRAGLDLHYSQGFNPHAVMSLPCPRPVGVASDGDILVLALNEPCVETPSSLAAKLTGSAPRGMRFDRAQPLPTARAPQVRTVHYRLWLSPARAAAAAARIDELSRADVWPVTREEKDTTEHPGRPKSARTIDLKPLVADLAAAPDGLVFVLGAGGGASARPAELLHLVGMDAHELSRLQRTAVETDLPPAP
ncbi:MAG: TIGR03936 family radical SAM-associated protein [Planctomycetota bacterium]|nr:TIGR03936 family radical SAM-associated protein [Planctomycetota bacterium]